MWKKGESLKCRFDARMRVTPGCWIWTGSKDSYGYGKLGFGGTSIRAYRASYQIYVGEIPPGLHVLHKCDVPSCVNPDHLFLGTHADNMADKTKKGRAIGARPGEGHYKAKLTAEKVLKIRADNRSAREIAKDYGVHRTTIDDVLSRKCWASV